MSVHFSSETDLWATPQDFFDRLNAAYQFELDVCATHDNAKCVRYFTKDDDGLAQEWCGVVWCGVDESAVRTRDRCLDA